MRILVVTPSPPHPTRGGAAIRNWHLIAAARAAGHHVEVLTFDTGTDGAPSAPRRSLPARAAGLLFAREPDLVRRLGAADLRPHVAEAIERGRIDLVQIEGLEMWPSLPARHGRTIYDAHNAEATLQSRAARQAWRDRDLPRAAYSALQSRALRRYEAAVLRRADATIAVSPADAAALRRLAPERAIDLVPIGVDTAYYAPGLAAPPEAVFDVLFTGTMDYRANADAAGWFLRAVWPRIRSANADARLGIVGHRPGRSLLRYDGRDGVTVTGAVGDDRPYMAGAKVYVLPIRFGAGVRVKLLNAMAMGCAIVTTPAGAEGVDVVNGAQLIVAPPQPARFAEAVCRALADPAERARLGHAACVHAAVTYDWSVCTPSLLAVYDRLERQYG